MVENCTVANGDTTGLNQATGITNQDGVDRRFRIVRFVRVV